MKSNCSAARLAAGLETPRAMLTREPTADPMSRQNAFRYPSVQMFKPIMTKSVVAETMT